MQLSFDFFSWNTLSAISYLHGEFSDYLAFIQQFVMKIWIMARTGGDMFTPQLGTYILQRFCQLFHGLCFLGAQCTVSFLYLE